MIVISERQLEVARLVAEGRSNKEIARQLGISDATVKLHIKIVMTAIGAPNRTALAIAVFAEGFKALPARRGWTVQPSQVRNYQRRAVA